MTPTTEAGTKAGQRLLAGMPWTTKREHESWLRLILAIEAEAREQERARIRAGVEALIEYGPDRDVVLAIVRGGQPREPS